jgi:hypothetical protein
VKRGGEAARDPERALVLDRIRNALRQPPAPAELSRDYGSEAMHLSAMSALEIVAAEEPSLLADLLENAAGDLVRGRTLRAVQEVFEDASHPRLVEALGNVARDEGVRLDDRIWALELLDQAPEADAAEVARLRKLLDAED